MKTLTCSGQSLAHLCKLSSSSQDLPCSLVEVDWLVGLYYIYVPEEISNLEGGGDVFDTFIDLCILHFT